MNKKQYDVVIIGAGLGGSAAAKYAAALGARVALVDKNKQTIDGCSPDDAALSNRTVIEATKQADPKWKDIKKRIEKVKSLAYESQSCKQSYDELSIDVYVGEASFINERTIVVGKHELVAKSILIATGSKPYIPAINGLKDFPYETEQTIFNCNKLPRTLAIIGGGRVAVETASVLQKLGVKVSIVEHNSCILKNIDSDASELTATSLRQAGTAVYTSASVIKISAKRKNLSVQVRQAGEPVNIIVESLMIAAGQRPVLPKGLKKTGMTVQAEGIEIDDQWRTTCKNIYAIGGVAQTKNKCQHSAMTAAVSAMNNALLGVTNPDISEYQPLTVFCDAPVAQVGEPVHNLIKNEVDHIVFEQNASRVDKAVMDHNAYHLIKIITDKNLYVTGATIVGRGSDEAIGYIAMAIRQKLKLTDLSKLPLPYPTLAFEIKQLAMNHLLETASQRKRFMLLRIAKTLLR